MHLYVYNKKIPTAKLTYTICHESFTAFVDFYVTVKDLSLTHN